MSARSISAPGEDIGGGVQRASATSRAREKRASGRDPSVPPRAGASFDPVPVGPGKRLPPRLAGEMSSRFAQDFSTVRVHDDAEAGTRADAIDARAYTIGEDIVLSPATSSLDTQAGRRTIAHELAHVVQQRRGGSAPPLSPDAVHETGAEQVASRAVGGQGPLAVEGGTAVGVAREKDERKKKAPVKPKASGKGNKAAPSKAPAMTVDPDISEDVERSFVEEDKVQPPPTSPKPVRRQSNQDAKDARKQFNRDRDTYADKLGVDKGGQVHHRVEVQALKRYPGAFSKDEINDEGAMRGIRPELDGKRQLHNSKIREAWDRHYIKLDSLIKQRGLKAGTPEWKTFVRKYMADAGDEMDYLYGPLYSEAHKGQPGAGKTAPNVPANKGATGKKAAPADKGKAPVGKGKPASQGKPAATPPVAKTGAPKPAPKAAPKATSKAGPKTPAKAAPGAAPKAGPAPVPKASPKSAPKSATPTPAVGPKVTPKVTPKAMPSTAPKTAPKPTPSVVPKVAPKVTMPSPTTRTPPPKPATPSPKMPGVRGMGLRTPSVPLRSTFKGTGGRGIGLLISFAAALFASKVEAAVKEDRNRALMTAEASAMEADFARQLAEHTDEVLTLQATNPFATVYANVTYDTYTEDTRIVAGDTVIEDTNYYGTTVSRVGVGYLPLPGSYTESDGSMARGAFDNHEFQTIPVELSLAPIEELVAHAKTHGVPLTGLRAYAQSRLREAGESSDGGLGPRMHAYWSQIIADMDSP